MQNDSITTINEHMNSETKTLKKGGFRYSHILRDYERFLIL